MRRAPETGPFYYCRSEILDSIELGIILENGQIGNFGLSIEPFGGVGRELTEKADTSGIGLFMDSMKGGLTRCLDPAMNCTKDAIRAHSVQNATALGFIEEEGHVVTIKQSVKDGEPGISFERIGRKQASTFTGLCNEHDTKIFKPIDSRPISDNDREQLFLLAYRSVTREFHAVLEGASRIQTAFQRLVERGEVPKDDPSPEGMEALQHFMKAYGTWRYRYKFFDQNLEKSRFGNILHSTITLRHTEPIIAASSFFSVVDKVWGRPFPAAIVNIIPTSSDETLVVVSYEKEHSGIVRRFFAPIKMETDENKQLLLLSHMIVERMENFFVRPSLVSKWSNEKKNFILSSYISTVVAGAQIPIDTRLMLFE